MNTTVIKTQIETTLEKHGFLRSVAGDTDFNAVLAATAAVLGHQKVGIYFAGAVGVGKTCAARAAAQTIAEMERRAPPKIIRAFSEDHLKTLPSIAEDRENPSDVLIDDLATDMILREYGNEKDPIANFVANWIADMEDGYKTRLLYLTTNLDTKGIEARYGARVFDRLGWNLATCQFRGSTKRNSGRSLWREKTFSREELAVAASKALAKDNPYFVRDDDGEKLISEKVDKWIAENEVTVAFRAAAAELATKLSARRAG